MLDFRGTNSLELFPKKVKMSEQEEATSLSCLRVQFMVNEITVVLKSTKL